MEEKKGKHIIKLKNINTSIHPDYVEIKDLENFRQFMCIANENKYFNDIIDLSGDNIKNFCNILIDYYKDNYSYNSSLISLRMLSIKNSELGSTFDNEFRKIAENYGIENLDIKFGSDKIATWETIDKIKLILKEKNKRKKFLKQLNTAVNEIEDCVIDVDQTKDI